MVSSTYKLDVFLMGILRSDAPHRALANLPDDANGSAVNRFKNRWGQLITEARVERIGLEIKQEGFNIFEGYETRETILREVLRKAWRGDQNALQFVKDSISYEMSVIWAFRKGKSEIKLEDLWSTICVLFLEDQAAGKIAVCANPNCPSPFFVRKRSTQLYCEAGDCVSFAQRKYAKKWWDTQGKKKRASKSRSKR